MCGRVCPRLVRHVGPLDSFTPTIRGHWNLFCKMTMLTFGSHRATQCRAALVRAADKSWRQLWSELDLSLANSCTNKAESGSGAALFPAGGGCRKSETTLVKHNSKFVHKKVFTFPGRTSEQAEHFARIRENKVLEPRSEELRLLSGLF
jgi:hypothetical protein